MMTPWHNSQELLHACVFGLCTVYSWIKSSVKFIYLRAAIWMFCKYYRHYAQLFL